MTPSPGGSHQGAAATVPLDALGGHLLRIAQQRHTAIWLEEIGTEPTGPQYAVLAALEAEPGADQRRLGAMASLDRSSTTDVVSRLGSRGWLTRSPDPADGRRDVIALDPRAVPAVRDLHPRVALVQARLLAPLDVAEHDHLVRDLAALARVAEDEWVAVPGSPLHIPGHLLRRTQQVHTALFAEAFGRALTGPQYAVLHVLAGEPGISQQALGERARLDRSTTADLVARLERRGRLVRERDVQDGRRRVLALTAAGMQEVAGAWPRVLELQARLLAPLGRGREAFLARLGPVARVDAPAAHPVE